MEDVHRRRVPVLKYIPKQLRPLWSQCLAKALANCSHFNDVAHWVELQMLAKCVLCAPLRGGKQHENQRLAFTRHRLQRWLDGERANLWRDIPNYRPPRRDKPTTPEVEKALRHKRCEDLCRGVPNLRLARLSTPRSPSTRTELSMR